MPKGISIAIASDTTDFDRGVRKGIVDPLEEAVDTLDRLGKAGEQAGRDAEQGLGDVERAAEQAGDAARAAGDDLEDAMRDAQRDTGQLSDEMRELRDRIENAQRSTRDLGDSGKRAGRDYERGLRDAGDGLDEFRDEAGSTAREAAASFDGSAESIGDAFQEVAANAFAGFGPAGAVAGIAAAAGLGVVIAAFQGIDEANQESRQRAADWGQAFIEAGDTALQAATRTQLAMDIVADPERWQEAQDNAREWGVTTATALAAMTGETWALEAAEAALSEREAEAAETRSQLTDSGELLSEMLQGTTAETRNGREALDQLNRELDNGAGMMGTFSEYLRLTAENTAGATREVDEFGDSVYSLPDGTQIYIDAETGQATRDVDAIERRIYGIPDEASVDVSINDRAVRDWMRRSLDRTATVTYNQIVRSGLRNVV